MNLADALQEVLSVVSQFAGVTLPRIVAALVGLLMLVTVVVGRWERRLRAAPALFLALAGVLLLAMATDPRLLHALAATTFLTRIRILLGLLSALVVVVTFEAIRRSRLQERYALLWLGTGFMVLLLAFMPQLLDFLRTVLGVQYATAVVGVVFTFLLLVSFHFSLALSGLEDDRSRLAQRLALLEVRLTEVEQATGLAPPVPSAAVENVASPSERPTGRDRAVSGTVAACAGVMGVVILAAVGVGLLRPQAMIGDEVTHYFLLRRQAEMLPSPTYVAPIPVGWSVDPETRVYAHPVGWHYLGALFHRLSGGSFQSVQIYHSLYWIQLLLVGFLWVRARGGIASRAALLYMIVLATVPMNLLFSVAFYQDVPMAAQALTAFYLADRRRYVGGALFLALALWIKVTGVVFLPPFLAVVLVRWIGERRAATAAAGKSSEPLLGLARMALAVAIPLIAMLGTAHSLRVHAAAPYYPFERVAAAARSFSRATTGKTAIPDETDATGERAAAQDAPLPIMANYPGDLRIKANFVIYGGGLIWILLLTGTLGLLRPRGATVPAHSSRRQWWPIAVGLFYLAVTAWQVRSSPDARFFLPALPFILLPLSEWTARLPRYRWMLIGFTALGMVQGYQVLAKTLDLRALPPPLVETIRFLEANRPVPERVFMYPEGNYRFFPVPHEWHLDKRLREFWRADNDRRIALLREHHVGAVVVKKHLIRDVDERVIDLGAYPPAFIRDLEQDPRFERVFDNEAASVFLLPPPP